MHSLFRPGRRWCLLVGCGDNRVVFMDQPPGERQRPPHPTGGQGSAMTNRAKESEDVVTEAEEKK